MLRADTRPGWPERALGPVLLAYLRRVGRGATLVCLDDRHERPVTPTDVARRIRDEASAGRPVVLTYFVADSLGIAVAPFAHPALEQMLRAFHVLADVTLGGRTTASLVSRAGGSATLLPLPGDPERLRHLRTIMTSGASVAFAVDGGGPYGRVGTGVVALAGVLGASIVPLAVRIRPAMPLLHRSRVAFPLPGCRLTVAVGSPLAVDRHGDRRATAAALERVLHGLRTRTTSAPRTP